MFRCFTGGYPYSRAVGKGYFSIEDRHSVEYIIGYQKVSVEVGPIDQGESWLAADTAQEVSVMQPIMTFIYRARARAIILRAARNPRISSA